MKPVMILVTVTIGGFVVITLIAFCGGMIGAKLPKVSDQEKALASDPEMAFAEIQELGGKIAVRTNADGESAIRVDFSHFPESVLDALTEADVPRPPAHGPHFPVVVPEVKHHKTPPLRQKFDPEIADALKQLQELNLDGTKVTDAGLEHLKGLTQLRTLNLSGTTITDSGLKHLQSFTELQKVNLRGTKVTDAGLQHIAGLTQLQELNLTHTRVTDAGLQHLTGLTQLQTLDLTFTPVTGTGLDHIKSLPHLQTLHLALTPVTDAALEHLKGSTQLRELSLNGTDVTEAGAESLRKAVPTLRILR